MYTPPLGHINMSKNLHKRNKKTFHERLKDNDYILNQRIIDNTNKSDEKYTLRIYKRVKTMLDEKYTYFITYTINDISLEKTTEIQHVKKIKATLPGATYYLINNDYGDLTNRLHYHALASFSHEYDTTLLNQYQYGYTNIKPIKDKDAYALGQYILKLTNHTIKKSVAKIWRSRKK